MPKAKAKSLALVFLKSLGPPTLAVLTVLIILVALWQFPQWQLSSKKLSSPDKQAEMENAYRATLVQAFGGVFFFVTAWLTWRNVKATEEKQVAERFSKAIELLGNEKLEVRLGGIYALERIAKDSEKDYWTIMEVLTGFVRERSQLRWQKGEAAASLDADTKEEVEKQLAPPSTDIRAVLTILNRRTQSYKQREKERLDLSGSDFSWMILAGVSFKEMNLQEANLEKANLSKANLSGTDLRRANLRRSRLEIANLSEANLSEANLSASDLRKANLYLADLSRVKLGGAKLIEADLGLADFNGADLWRADLREASLMGSDLRKANLGEADLRGANLNGANLREANLIRSDLRGANLHAADLRKVIDLTQEQISKAMTSKDTWLPAYLQAPESSQPETPSQTQ